MKDFSKEFTSLLANNTKLPFNVGGLVQPGKNKTVGYNNQDALSIAVDENYIAGVVCDGCASAYNANYNSSSMNEFAAHAMSMIITNAIRENINKTSDVETLLLKIDKYLHTHLRAVKRALLCIRNSNGKKLYSLDEADYIDGNLLAATLIGIIITPKSWVIFNYGDGVCGVNGEFSALENFSGEYYSKKFLNTNFCKLRRCSFNIFAQGKTSELKNVIIGTDGMLDFIDTPDNELVRFLKLDKSLKYKRGISTSMEFTREFRRRVSIPFEKRTTPTSWDDRAFIAIRRIER